MCGTVWRSVRRVARVMALASEASTPCQLQPGTLAILKEANSCTIRQSLGGRYPGAPSSGVWCRVLPRRLGLGFLIWCGLDILRSLVVLEK